MSRNHALKVILLAGLCAAAALRAGETAATGLPEGVKPFDPAGLTAKLAERIKTDDFTFAAFGDTKHKPVFTEKVIPFLVKLNPDFILTTGDQVQAGGGLPGPGFWELLSGEAGADMRLRPWWPAIGNHEIAGDPIVNKGEEEQVLARNAASGKALFKQFYSMPEVYYSFNFRHAAFIALPYPNAQGEALNWLLAELNKAREAGKLIFVFNHCPFYTVGSKSKGQVPNAPTENTKLFEKFGVLAVFSGHDHIYYRTLRGGIPYIVTAGGGAQLYELKRTAEALPEDVYYGKVPVAKDSKDPASYQYVNGITGAKKTTSEPDQFVSLIKVQGKNVTLKTYNMAGEVWDEMTLSKEK